MRLIALWLFLLMPSWVYAGNYDSVYLKLGGALNQPTLLTNKLVSFGIQHEAFWVFDYQIESGAFTDTQNVYISPTFFLGPSIGVSIVRSAFYVKVFFGPALVSHTDEHLSTPYEFHTDLQLGFKDYRGVGIGLGYKHLSNAGIQGPNIGRDFLYFQISLP